MQPELRRPQGVGTHVDWRYRCLRSAGFGSAEGGRLAGNAAFDLHELLELLDWGCPRNLAVRIVAPLHSERDPR